MGVSRTVQVSTPLGEGALLFRRMTAVEELGRLFEFDLELLSRDPQVPFEDLLGQPVTVALELQDGSLRYFNGFVSRFSQAGSVGHFARYHATLRPWLWFLTRTADCRIFQGKTVPDIVKEVFREHGFTDFSEALGGSYRTWDYCVQYRETDFNFVSRLMEQEGIYYYFTHEDGKHTLVLADSPSSHDLIPGYEEIPYYPPSDNVIREDHLSGWGLSQEIQPGAYALDDFDFEKPRASLAAKASVSRRHAAASYEVYDYPGEYVQTPDGEAYARVRIEELHARHEQAVGRGNARGIAAGGLFRLAGFPREDQNREYLVVSATHEVEAENYESSGSGAGGAYACQFGAVGSQQPFRPARITPKPTVQGPQTAVVVGKDGEELWTDQYGRVKVRFHWDRDDEKKGEDSTCWIRVAQVWAGKGWGAIHTPRIGQEVIVEFLEGDPDRPIITGRVYNADNMPPYDLPANQTQSGIKSRSTKRGAGENYNEIRFEDKKGEEELLIHAEKNQTIEVENDENHTVGNNRTKTVGVDETTSVGNNETETIGANWSVKVGKNKTETVVINTAETIGVAKELTIGGLYQVTVGAAMNETVGAAKAEEIGAAKAVLVGGNSSEKVGANKSVDAGKDVSVTAGKDLSEKAGKKMLLEAGDEILIKTGSASILMKKDGTIRIEGKDITIKGSGAIHVKATKDVVVKGKKILQN